MRKWCSAVLWPLHVLLAQTHGSSCLDPRQPIDGQILTACRVTMVACFVVPGVLTAGMLQRVVKTTWLQFSVLGNRPLWHGALDTTHGSHKWLLTVGMFLAPCCTADLCVFVSITVLIVIACLISFSALPTIFHPISSYCAALLVQCCMTS